MNRRDLFRLPLARVEALAGTAPAPRSTPAPPPPVSVLACSPLEVTESPVRGWELLRGMRGKWPVLWVHAAGMEHAPTVEGLRTLFGFPARLAERLLDPRARGSVERFGDHLLVLVPFGAEEETAGGDLGRAAVVVGPEYVVTLQAGPGDRFADLREEVRSPHSRYRKGGPGMVALAAAAPLLEALAEAAEAYARGVEEAEDALREDPSTEALDRLHTLRRELRLVRRALEPLPAALRALASDPDPLPADAAGRLHDLATRSADALESVDAAREGAALLGERTLALLHRRGAARSRALLLLAGLFLPVAAVAAFLLLLEGAAVVLPPALIVALPPVAAAVTLVALAAGGYLHGD